MESTDSNTAVDLESLADIVCKRNKVLYYSYDRNKFDEFCKISKTAICPRTGKTRDSETAECEAVDSKRIRYQTIKIHKSVCEYEGGDETVKYVQKEMKKKSYAYTINREGTKFILQQNKKKTPTVFTRLFVHVLYISCQAVLIFNLLI